MNTSSLLFHRGCVAQGDFVSLEWGGVTSAAVHRTDSDQPWPADQRLWTLLIQHSSFIFVLPHCGPLSPAVLNPVWVTWISISSKGPNHQVRQEPLNCNTVVCSDLTLLHGPPRTVAFTSLLIPNKKRQKQQAEVISLHLHQTWESSTQVLKAEYQVAHGVVQQELRWQN